MRRNELCQCCKRECVEIIDGWNSSQCGRCNDRDIEYSNKRREWDYYHPGQPCPKSELPIEALTMGGENNG
jgi:hypothetical protein